MRDPAERFHSDWLGLVQPTDGLVVSIPVLVEAQCLSRQPPEVQVRLRELAPEVESPASASQPDRALTELRAFLSGILGLDAEHLLDGESLPEAHTLYVPEGGQTLRPTLALRRPGTGEPLALIWDLGPECVGLSLDRAETRTGPWDYPPGAKLDRLLRHARVPIGLLTNRTSVRLVYAPHGESSGSITFRLADMARVDGRPILDAFVMLLGATRWFGVAPEHQLPALLGESRRRQANVTNELAEQMLGALELLLRGFEAAAERDGWASLKAALDRADDGLYDGLLTLLLRLVFVLYAEDRDLLPVEHTLYARHLSALGLFEELQRDHGLHPDTMARRFGAYGRLIALFRAIYRGVEHDTLRMPPRQGELFSPDRFPFVEGWPPELGQSPMEDAEARAAVRLPSLDDETVFRVLEKLLVFQRQRLSYKALKVEQIGSVYEALMGYAVRKLDTPAVCLRPARVWVTAEELLAEPPALRARWLKDQAGLTKAQADKLARAVGGSRKPETVLDELEELAVRGVGRAPAGRLVIQPGPERRRTSSHYTPPELAGPIAEKTLAPLVQALGPAPASERLLTLKVCDPAMGSGAFLVAACKVLADHVVAAWRREGRQDLVGGTEDVTLVARRLVAQRCLYGVDCNRSAVILAKMALWMETLARDWPFTFLDHALKWGDSLVGLSFEQITSFHWKPQAQIPLCRTELDAVLTEAVGARQRILALAGDISSEAHTEKEWLLRDAEDALDRVRLVGDLVVGAFFSSDKDREREAERDRRLVLVERWLASGKEPPVELRALQAQIRGRLPVFHWMAEYPEVFWVERPDPLNGEVVGKRAWIDAFLGNPPFAGKNGITENGGEGYLEWLQALHEGAHGNADYSAHFFRRADELLGDHGTIGLIATNTIAQGDTRQTGRLR